MKRNLFILSGSGFIGLNFIKNFKNKNYKIYLIGKKSRYNFFKTRISKKIKIIYENILSSKKIKKIIFIIP